MEQILGVKDPGTEAILNEARKIVSDRLPEKQEEFEIHFTKISQASAVVRGQLAMVWLIGRFRKLFGKNSTLEQYQLN